MASKPHTIIVGSYTNAIYTLEFTAEPTPTLKLSQSLDVGHHPSWLSVLPSEATKGEHTTVVLTGLEQSDGQVVAIGFDSKGNGTVLSQVSSAGRDPASLRVHPSGKEVVVGNYSSGHLTTIPLASEEPYLKPSSNHVLHFEGTGPRAGRQESSHPHDVYFYRDEMIVPDLGADKTWRLQRDESGRWAVAGHVEYEAGSGPRHVVVQDDVLYTALELKSRVSAHRIPALPAAPEHLGTTSTLTSEPAPEALVAEILLPAPTSSFPTQYLYVSNRNDPSPEGDIISIISIVDGVPELVSETRTGLRHLRGMQFDPTGRWLIAGGAIGGGAKVFERVDNGKGLKEIASIDLEAPTTFLWL